MWKAIQFFGVILVLVMAVVSISPGRHDSQQERAAGWAFRFVVNIVTVPIAAFGVIACFSGFLGSGGGWIALGIAALVVSGILRSCVIPLLAGKEPWSR